MGVLPELLFGNMGAELPTYGRIDITCAADQVDSPNTVANGKRINGFLESNRGSRKERMLECGVYLGMYKYCRWID